MCSNIPNRYVSWKRGGKKGDISTQRHPGSHTHRDHDLNFQHLPPGKHRCTQGASLLASYWVCVPLRAKTCPPSKPFMFLSTNSSLRDPWWWESVFHSTFEVWSRLTGNALLTTCRHAGTYIWTDLCCLIHRGWYSYLNVVLPCRACFFFLQNLSQLQESNG